MAALVWFCEADQIEDHRFRTMLGKPVCRAPMLVYVNVPGPQLGLLALKQRAVAEDDNCGRLLADWQGCRSAQALYPYWE